ncbi:MAG: transposase [Puniceicoccales bacterium]|jgi:transposase-like protein|nr:transposase [Puniceicoccales bacterium]
MENEKKKWSSRIKRQPRRRKSPKIYGDFDLANMAFRKIKKCAIEILYSEELESFLGFEKFARKLGRRENYRNGVSQKVVKSCNGPITLKVPRDRQGLYKAKIVGKYKNNIYDIEDALIALCAQGLTLSDTVEYLREIYKNEISAEDLSRFANRMITESSGVISKSIQPTCAIIYMDSRTFKFQSDETCSENNIYACIGIDRNGYKEVFGVYAVPEDHDEQYWVEAMKSLKTRGLSDLMIFCSSDLPKLNEAIHICFPFADRQKCIFSQIRSFIDIIEAKHVDAICGNIRDVFAAPHADAGLERLEMFCLKWNPHYENIGEIWRENWDSLSAYWRYPVEMRKLIPISGIFSLRQCC